MNCLVLAKVSLLPIISLPRVFCFTMGDDSSTPRLPGPLHRRRRNSISTSTSSSALLPSHLSSSAKPRHSSSFPTQNGATTPPQLDLDLLSLKTTSDSYTSLKDLLPSSSSSSFSAVQSPTPNTTSSPNYEISIRNRLVKQAAWAYLQPMSSASGPSGPRFLHRLWLNLSSFLSRTLRRLLPCFTLS